MTERRCSECGQILPNIRFGARLGPIAARIFDAVHRAGADGIEHGDLFELIYGGTNRKRTALAGYVRQINDRLADQQSPVRIRSVSRSYYRIARAEEAARQRA
jgi:hypothetical protein